MLIIKQLSYIYIIFCIIHIILCINGYPLTRIVKNLQECVTLGEKNNLYKEEVEELKKCIHQSYVMRSYDYRIINIIIMCMPIFHIIVIVAELSTKWILYKWNH